MFQLLKLQKVDVGVRLLLSYDVPSSVDDTKQVEHTVSSMASAAVFIDKAILGYLRAKLARYVDHKEILAMRSKTYEPTEERLDALDRCRLLAERVQSCTTVEVARMIWKERKSLEKILPPASHTHYARAKWNLDDMLSGVSDLLFNRKEYVLES